MLRHVVLFRWSPEATEEARADVARALDGLPGAIPAIARYHHGPDAGLDEGNWDYAVVGEFADDDAYATYRDHRSHQAVITQLIRPILAERAAVQYRIDG